MNSIMKRHIVKVPKNVSIYYCDTNHLILLVTSFAQQVLSLRTKLIVDKKKRIIKVTRHPFFSLSTNERKKLKAVQGTQVSLLKQTLLNITLFFCKKLNLVGVGFRVSTLKIFDLNLLHFKLGYSHQIYFKIPTKLKISCLKTTQIFIFGYSYLFVTQIAALLRSYKAPEPYKGKGIIYTTEKMILKEGKKV